jgi:hypothetical protein
MKFCDRFKTLAEDEMGKQSWFEMVISYGPLLVVWLAFLIAGLADLLPRQRTRGPKWLWFCAVIFLSIIGPTAYFLFGRRKLGVRSA